MQAIRHLLTITFIILISSSCKTDSDLIKKENIISIRVIKNFNPFANDWGKNALIINNADSINKFVAAINSAKPYLVKFFADYKLEINYPDTVIRVSCRNKYISIGGKAYKVNQEIKSLF